MYLDRHYMPHQDCWRTVDSIDMFVRIEAPTATYSSTSATNQHKCEELEAQTTGQGQRARETGVAAAWDMGAAEVEE